LFLFERGRVVSATLPRRFILKRKVMKIIFLRKQEKKILAQALYELVRKPGCPYELTRILEKLDRSKYEKAFGIMNINK
jgi:hypothetical protein